MQWTNCGMPVNELRDPGEQIERFWLTSWGISVDKLSDDAVEQIEGYQWTNSGILRMLKGKIENFKNMASLRNMSGIDSRRFFLVCTIVPLKLEQL